VLRKCHPHFMMTYVARVVLVLCMFKTLFMKIYSGYVTRRTHLPDIK
jgi:hypothetical protein